METTYIVLADSIAIIEQKLDKNGDITHTDWYFIELFYSKITNSLFITTLN